MKLPQGRQSDQTYSGRYTGGQSLRASTNTGFVESGGVTVERVKDRSTEYRGRDRLIGGMNVDLSSRDC